MDAQDQGLKKNEFSSKIPHSAIGGFWYYHVAPSQIIGI
jgi:hypothetical protein